MQARTIPRSYSLSHQIVEIITSRIRDGTYAPESQLPSENEMAEEFGVSRTTVRNAFSKLAARGLVVRRQGVGTFVSQLSRISNPLNVATDFSGLLKRSGIKHKMELVSAIFTLPDKDLAQALQIGRTNAVLETHRVIYTEDQPIIYCITSLPGWLFDEELAHDPVEYAKRAASLYAFLENDCGQLVEYHIARIRSGMVPDYEFQIPLPANPPCLLIITETAYNTEERPLWHAEEYFLGDLMTFEVVRYSDLAGREAKWRK